MGPFLRSRAASATAEAAASAKEGDDGSTREAANPNLSLRPEDVLIGRGKGAYLSEGNRRYMQVVHSFLPTYMAAATNQDKIQITKDIVAHVKDKGGRFMGIDSRGNLHEVPDKQARIKVAQAIRNKRRQLHGERSTGSARSSSANTCPIGNSDRTKPSHHSADASHMSLDASHRSIDVSQRSFDASHGSAEEISALPVAAASDEYSFMSLPDAGVAFHDRPRDVDHEAIAFAHDQPGDVDHEAIAFALGAAVQPLQPGGATGIQRGSNRLSEEAAGYLSESFSLLSLSESDRQSLFNLSSDSDNKSQKNTSSSTSSSQKKPSAKKGSSNSDDQKKPAGTKKES